MRGKSVRAAVNVVWVGPHEWGLTWLLPLAPWPHMPLERRAISVCLASQPEPPA